MFRDRFSYAIENIGMSPIVGISEEAMALEPFFKARTGKSFLYFQRGEMGYDTPDYIKIALIKALLDGKTKYPKSSGEGLLKLAIVDRLKQDSVRNISVKNIVCTAGGQEALQLSFRLFDGEKGATFSPFWSCISENQAPYASIDLQEVCLNDDFSIDFNVLEEMLSNVSFFYFNNPQNPTGKVFSREDVEKIAYLCYTHGVYLISDEAYQDIVFDGEKHFSASLIDLPNIICAFTFSKSFAMTGWRLGYVFVRDVDMAEKLTRANYTQTAGVPPFIQYAGAEALNNHELREHHLVMKLREFEAKRDRMYKGLQEINKLTIHKPGGAFYFFPSFANFIPKGLSEEDYKMFIHKLLLEEGVVVIPGYCFGTGFEANVRLSFSTTSLEEIDDGVARIKKALSRL